MSVSQLNQSDHSPEVQFSLRDPVRVEVGGQRGDVPNIGVVHQRVEGNGASVQIVEDLRPSPQITAVKHSSVLRLITVFTWSRGWSLHLVALGSSLRVSPALSRVVR